ncbi:MAG: TonB family protein [Thermostichus sp. BF3_bins_97]
MEQEAQSDEALALCKDRQRDRDLDLPGFLSELSTEPTPIPRFTPLLDGINASQGKASPEVLDFANRFSKEQREIRAAWLKDLTTKVESKWIPPKEGLSRKTIVTFTVRRDGNIKNPRISESSGDDLTDRAALEAVQDASPLAPLPKFFPDSVTVNFSFNIYVRHQ